MNGPARIRRISGRPSAGALGWCEEEDVLAGALGRGVRKGSAGAGLLDLAVGDWGFDQAAGEFLPMGST